MQVRFLLYSFYQTDAVNEVFEGNLQARLEMHAFEPVE